MKQAKSVADSFWSRWFTVPVIAGVVGLSLILGFSSGSIVGARANHAPVQIAQETDEIAPSSETPSGKSGRKVDPIEDYQGALNLLKKKYYGGPIDEKKTRQLTYSAIRGMLASLRDQYTGFLDPAEWKDMRETTDGDFEGIGAVLSPDKGEIRVFELIEGSPADKTGIKPDDIIVRVNGTSVIGKDLTEVVKMIKGPRGTKVRISVLRNKKQQDFQITRARVIAPVVKWHMADYENKVGYIYLKEFNKKSVEQMEKAFEQLKQQGMKALIFDLRFNPGGLLETAVDVSSVFIPRDLKPELDNVVVTIREGTGTEMRRELRSSKYMADGMPLVVLVNEGSASASEIVSGAVKDYGVGTIIGERTFGKGKVQTLFPLDDGSALRLTTALYFPPARQDINFKVDAEGVRLPNTGGIVPDIEVTQPDDWRGPTDKDRTKDRQYQKALTFLRARLKGNTVAQATELVKKP
jgi:carboxyl-terminal processing protease